MRLQVAHLRSENARLLRLLDLTPAQARRPGPVQTGIFDAAPGSVDLGSSPSVKVAFFAALFGARTDVYAVRWENRRSGKAKWMPAVRGGWRRGVPAVQRDYLPLTEEVLTAHLSGELDLGLYPLLDGDQCWWLAADFDGPAAMLDALAYLKAARAVGAPVALEVSRSGRTCRPAAATSTRNNPAIAVRVGAGNSITSFSTRAAGSGVATPVRLTAGPIVRKPARWSRTGGARSWARRQEARWAAKGLLAHGCFQADAVAAELAAAGPSPIGGLAAAEKCFCFEVSVNGTKLLAARTSKPLRRPRSRRGPTHRGGPAIQPAPTPSRPSNPTPEHAQTRWIASVGTGRGGTPEAVLPSGQR